MQHISRYHSSSNTEQFFLVAMVVIILWLHSTIPFLDGECMHQNLKCTLQLLANSLKCLQVKVVSLSVNILVSKPCSKKIVYNWRMSQVASCRRNGYHIANLEGLQSIENAHDCYRLCPLLICSSCSPHPVFLSSNEMVLDLLTRRLCSH